MARLILIDETYQVPNSLGRDPFYAFAVVSMPKHHAVQVREQMQTLVASNYWHATESLANASGRKTLALVLEVIHRQTDHFVYETSKIEPTDRYCESTRARLLREVIIDLELQPGDSGDLVRYEKRSPSFAANSDLRVIQELRTRRVLMPEHMIHPASPSNEPLLWLPDAVACAFRQSITRGNSTLISELPSLEILVK